MKPIGRTLLIRQLPLPNSARGIQLPGTPSTMPLVQGQVLAVGPTAKTNGVSSYVPGQLVMFTPGQTMRVMGRNDDGSRDVVLDADDIWFLSVNHSGKSHLLVTGDRVLVRLGYYEDARGEIASSFGDQFLTGLIREVELGSSAVLVQVCADVATPRRDELFRGINRPVWFMRDQDASLRQCTAAERKRPGVRGLLANFRTFSLDGGVFAALGSRWVEAVTLE